MIKPYRLRRRRMAFATDDRPYDPKDGINVNRIKWGWCISSHSGHMSVHDSPNLYERTKVGTHRTLGIMKQVGRTNRYKSLNLNGEVRRLNRKAYNVR